MMDGFIMDRPMPGPRAVGSGRVGMGGGNWLRFGSGVRRLGSFFPRGRADPGLRGGAAGRHWPRFVDRLGIGIGFVFPATPDGRWLRLPRERLDRRGNEWRKNATDLLWCQRVATNWL